MPPVTKTIQHADTDVFAAIAHPVRRKLLDMLAVHEHSVKDLAEPFDLSRPAISQHLRILLDVGLVSEYRQGREHRYQLHAEHLSEVSHWVQQYERFWHKRLDALGKYLEEQE
ncbi:ArsR/SmtB family transcription factor [Dictyobacter aurantiacus]|uniref:Transcriptional regulator n=1 Tax=Dictyobacter aurantiacus TaxID=1936993 RepID=A0A401ZSZ1_9CHLR|nr:metalloregulator ArsR/SmtB family transcription factor [Dictyobacter aurantiacus]GCE09981.1 transcriptional regulator [Dictyobacter aurantiacus]